MNLWQRAFSRTTTMCILFAMTVGLCACQSAPPRATPRQGFTPEQIAVLRDQGFHQTAQGWEFDGSEKVLFGLNVAELSPEGLATVSRIGHALLGVGIRKLQLDGFTDNTGTHDYNMQLSERRAHAVAAALVDIGMRNQDIDVQGMGETEPVASNRTSEGRAQNRRVAIIVSSP